MKQMKETGENKSKHWMHVIHDHLSAEERAVMAHTSVLFEQILESQYHHFVEEHGHIDRNYFKGVRISQLLANPWEPC